MTPVDPTRPLAWGILGTARIASRVAPAIQAAEDAELLGIASRSRERAETWKNEHGGTYCYGSYQQLLDDEKINAVYIPLPPAMHAEWTIRAAEQGKHVLCEKPLASSAAEAEEMAAACRMHNVQLMDGVMWYHHPRCAEMLLAIRDGTLGQLRRMTSAFSFHWDEVPHNDLRLDRSLRGGSLLDLGWYCVGATLWAFGEMPLRVYATGRYYRDVDMNCSGLMWFADDRVATFDSGFDVSMRKWFEVAGTNASLVCDDFTRPWDAAKPRFWIHDAQGKMAEHLSDTPIQEVCMIEDFCRLVKSGTPDEEWSRRAVDTQRVCDALDRSARTGTVVELQ